MSDRDELEALARRLCEGLERRDNGLRQYYEGVFAAGVTGAEMRIGQVEALGGDAVAEVGEHRMALQPPGGEPFEDVKKYLVVCRRDGEGRLRFWLDMFHSDGGAEAVPDA